MLRSLVGSEMCIRDSPVCDRARNRGGDLTLVFGDGACVCAARHVEVNVHGASAWRCLLYTSDAADDLLCVDLGGRRIIKKKKKKHKEQRNIENHTQHHITTPIN